MRRRNYLLSGGLIAGAVFFWSCGKPPVTKSVSVPAPLAHFRMTLQLKQDIEKDNLDTGSGPNTVFKTYDPVTVARGDFYLPQGADSEGVAEFSGGRRLLLKFVDLKFTPDSATARQYLFDANFQVQTAAGTYAAWPFSENSLATDAVFPLNGGDPNTLSGAPTMLSEVGFAEKGIMVNAGVSYQITYLGETSDRDLINRSSPPALFDPVPPTVEERVEADVQDLRSRGMAP